ncbi:hypothetical protein B0T10DRAFT_314939 [Thelonectria olida]|uniref:Uncharacterized protein n=1 Tax=Thelonectria olida TaxID=1576542 RepID=A0A9P8W5K6_9HYPO|nr:hypothetical protein B0T10DRAFT_314939 [Thelonectria olida]
MALNTIGDDQTTTAGPPTPQTPSGAGPNPTPNVEQQPLNKTPVAFAVDISGSTYGPTLAAEKAFIRSVSNLLSPRARFASKILPWDDKAHPILSLAQLDSLEDRGGTDPGALLSDARHSAALKDSSLWFLMTDGLIPDEARARFAHDVAKHGVHGISCIIVVFGNPSTGPASCDISVGVGVFAAVPNCAFLFCNETNGDLRVMQTKGSFDVLLKGQSHPVFDSSSRWDLLPQLSVADFAAVSVPAPKRLAAHDLALRDSLVINMDDLFANRLSPDQVARIFSTVDNLDSVRMTMQARNQQDDFRHWLRQQTIRPDDPLFKPRRDLGGKAESLFTELVDLVSRGQSPPPPLQARLRAAYRANMNSFITDAQRQIWSAQERSDVIGRVTATSFSPINHTPAMSPSTNDQVHYHYKSAPTPMSVDFEDDMTSGPHDAYNNLITPQNQVVSAPMPPGAPSRTRRTRQGIMSTAQYRGAAADESWGSWETDSLDASLRGLLYTSGLRSSNGSFKGTCPLCGATGMTMAWLFRAPSSGPYKPPTPDGGTEGFPAPGSRTRLAFPLAMGHFTETSGVLASLPPAPPLTPSRTSSSPLPTLVCDPCSVLYTRNGALSFGIAVALPMVRFTENREAVCSTLAAAFGHRFAEDDLPQVFLSVLMSATNTSVRTPMCPPTPAPSEMDFDISATMAAAAAANTFRAAIEWTARDMLYSVVALRELTQSFSLPSDTPAPVWPLATVLAGSFEELDSSSDDGPRGQVAPLLRYPLPGFITILKAAPLLGVSIELRRRAAFRRLLYLICEELDKAAEQVPHSQSVAQLFGGLLGRPLSTDPSAMGGQGEAEWKPSVSVSIQSLRFSSLLSASSYNMMSRAEEFRYLEDPFCLWLGPAVALFLHALFLVVTNMPRMSASEIFQAVTRMKFVGNALLRPEGVDRDDVDSILSQM